MLQYLKSVMNSPFINTVVHNITDDHGGLFHIGYILTLVGESAVQRRDDNILVDME